jgi:3-deoxy-7-phosphoheptulonate synthase
MLESFIEEGRQDVRPGTPLVYGQSITDACMSWERTTQLLEDLATATRGRRGRSSK